MFALMKSETHMERQAQPLFVALTEDGESAALLSSIAVELDELQAIFDELIVDQGLSQSAQAQLLAGLAVTRAELERALRQRGGGRANSEARLWRLRGILKRVRTLRRDTICLARQRDQSAEN
jgi:hypothetical protein